MTPLCAQGLCFSAHAFEAVGFLHWVQLSLLDEVPDVVDTGVGGVLSEGKRGVTSRVG